MSAYVYRAFDAGDRLLYVGCSVDVESRLRYHEENANWWPFMVRIEREEFATRDEAAAAEVMAIFNEHPRWNMVGRNPQHPDGQASDIRQATWLHYERDVTRRWRHAFYEETRMVRLVRQHRMALSGIKVEIQAIAAGLEIDEEVA